MSLRHSAPHSGTRPSHTNIVASIWLQALTMACVTLMVTCLSSYAAAQTTATGPLQVHRSNPRYFADPSGKAIYLTGSHTWNDFQDGNGIAFDYNAYLNLLTANNHNYIRLWIQESPRADVGLNPAPGWSGTTPWYQTAAPLPYARTGTGTAADGLPKFKLTQFDQTYFDRLRARVLAARDRGLYVGVMLFNFWSASNAADRVAGRNVWRYHPFNQANNTSGITADVNGDGNGPETHTLQVATITQLQETYLKKVVDTVNDLDNVIYEISNEDSGGDAAWQSQMVSVLKAYEATKPKQHPVGVTGWPGASTTSLLNNSAEWTSLGASSFDNATDPLIAAPPQADGTRVSLLDTDHLGYMVFRDDAAAASAWVWKSFTRGHNPIVKEDLGGNSGWQAARRAMGATRTYAARMNLGAMTPQSALCSTGYCLGSVGSEYLIYQPGSGAFTVSLAATSYNYEWFNPTSGSTVSTGVVGGIGGTQSFTPPFTGPAVLYLKASSLLNDPSAAAASSTTYRASTDFSGVQGQRGWYYLDSLGNQMTYNSTANRWQGAETYLLLSSSGGHPGNGADAVRRWVAPIAGTVQITGSASDLSLGGSGGVTVSIKRGTTVLWTQAIADGNTTGLGYNLTTSVAAGESLNFIINKGGDGTIDYDSTAFDPTITYTSTSTSTSTAPSTTSRTTTTTTASTTTTTSTSSTTLKASTTSALSTSTTPLLAAADTPTTYRASTDYSTVQGTRGWYYLDSLGNQLTYNSATARWQGSETYLFLRNDDGHPGNAADAVRRWVAPSAGTVSITGSAADTSTGGGGGVTVSIKRGTTTLWTQNIANGNTTGVTYNLTTSVAAGERLDFIINRGPDGNNSYDSTRFDPTITYTGATSPPPPPTSPPPPPTSPPPPPPGGTTYRASTDYSTVQGTRGWYYLDSLGNQLTYNSATARWQGSETYLFLRNDDGHPGNAADAVRRWVAPSAGTVSITGSAADTSTGGGGGVTVSIKRGTTTLWTQNIANGNTTGVTYNLTTSVAAGERLDFIINRGPDGDNSYDSTRFDPTITYTGATSPPPPPTSPPPPPTSPPPPPPTSPPPPPTSPPPPPVSPPPPPPGGTTYRASTDFSTIQGTRGWYYLDSLGNQLTYNSATARWQGSETYLFLRNDDGHPGNAADAVRRWVAPSAGTVSITGSAADTSTGGGGGVTVSIKRGTTTLWTQNIANGNTTGVTYNLTTSVAAGERLDFIINRGPDGNNSYDSTRFDPTITYTGATSPPPPPTSPPPPPPPGGTTYRASTDYSTVQGTRGWYYLDSAGNQLTYNASTARWQGSETYLFLRNDDGHPGNAADAVRRWVAPSAGTVAITGSASDTSTGGGGGVTVSIKRGTTTLWTQNIANGNTTGVSYNLTTSVAAGERLDFIINRGPDGSNSYDSTLFDPTITYTGGTSPPPPPPAPGTVSTLLTWNANTDPDLAGYRVYKGTSSGVYGTPVSVGNVTSYTAANLTAGVRYYFAISAVDTSGNESAKSAAVSILK